MTLVSLIIASAWVRLIVLIKSTIVELRASNRFKFTPIALCVFLIRTYISSEAVLFRTCNRIVD